MADEMKIEDLQKQADEYLNGWKRAKADFVNLQAETARERDEWIRFASARCIDHLLPVVDTLHAAASHEPSLVAVARKLDEFLAGEGVTPTATVGKYDPNAHEVIGREKKEGAEPGTIVTVVQAGYKLYGKTLRTAKVIVAE